MLIFNMTSNRYGDLTQYELSYLYATKVLGALQEAFIEFLTFISGSFTITEGCGKYTGTVFNEEFCHGMIITGGGTMQRCPTIGISCVDVTSVDS